VTPVIALETSIRKTRTETNLPPPPATSTPFTSISTPKIKKEYQEPQTLSTILKNTTISNPTRIPPPSLPFNYTEKEIKQEKVKKRKVGDFENFGDDVVLIEYFDNNFKKQRL